MQQHQKLGFEMEMSLLAFALKGLDEKTLPDDMTKLLRMRLEALDQEAQKFADPSVLQRMKQAINLGAEQEKLRAQLTSLAVFCIVCKLNAQSASRGLPIMIWQASYTAELATTVAESWATVPQGLRPVCYTTDPEAVSKLEESGAFICVHLCKEVELQLIKSRVEMDSTAFLMEKLQAMLPESAQTLISGGTPAPQRVQLPFGEFSDKCRDEAEQLTANVGDEPSATSKVRLVSATLSEPRYIASSGCHAFIAAHSSKKFILRIDPSNPCEPEKKLQLPSNDSYIHGIACHGKRLALRLGNGELHMCELETLTWRCLTKLEKWAYGLSMDDSTVYWADYCEETVNCLDLSTCQAHRLMGIPREKGCGKPGEQPEGFKLKEPIATAVLEDTLFVADGGNRRVLSFDMNTREMKIVYEGGRPRALAVQDGGLYVYDVNKHQVFGVCLETLKVQPVLGTGAKGFSKDGLPPLSTSLAFIGEGGLSFGSGGELLFADEDNGVVRALSLAKPSRSEATALLPASTRDWHSAHVRDNIEPAPEEERDLHHRMPYSVAVWQRLYQLAAGIHMSPQLAPKPITTLRATVAKPLGDFCVMLAPLRPVPHGLLDAFFLHCPEWDDSTYLETLGSIRLKCADTAGSEGWRRKMRAALEFMKNLMQNSPDDASTKFFLRKENFLEIKATCRYNEEEDSNTWQISSLKINGKARGGMLEAVTVGVDVPVAFFLLSAEGILQMIDTPIVV